jgi:fatty acid desaturase
MQLNYLSRVANQGRPHDLTAHLYFAARVGFFISAALIITSLHAAGGMGMIVSVVTYWLYCVLWNFWGWAGIGHELIHNSVFRTKVLNKVWLLIISFLSLSNHGLFRATHFTHHRYTHSDTDFESPLAYNKRTLGKSPSVLCGMVDLPKLRNTLRYLAQNSIGYIPAPALDKLIHQRGDIEEVKASARAIITYIFFVLCVCVILESVVLIIFLLLPNFIGTALSKSISTLQHPTRETLRSIGVDSVLSGDKVISLGSIPDSVVADRMDLKLPSLICFFYANMNFHASHHLEPSRPFYCLGVRSDENVAKGAVLRSTVNFHMLGLLAIRGI